MALERAFADVEALMGKGSMDSTRDELEKSDEAATRAVGYATNALEVLAHYTNTCESEDGNHVRKVKAAKRVVQELLIWRTYGLKMWIHCYPDAKHFHVGNGDVLRELKLTCYRTEQKLMHELIAGDSWSKLARKLRFCVQNREFSKEMQDCFRVPHATKHPTQLAETYHKTETDCHTCLTQELLTRIVGTMQLVQATRKGSLTELDPGDKLSYVDSQIFKEMTEDELFSSDVVTAVRSDSLRAQEPGWEQWQEQWHGRWQGQWHEWQAGQRVQAMPQFCAQDSTLTSMTGWAMNML